MKENVAQRIPQDPAKMKAVMEQNLPQKEAAPLGVQPYQSRLWALDRNVLRAHTGSRKTNGGDKEALPPQLETERSSYFLPPETVGRRVHKHSGMSSSRWPSPQAVGLPFITFWASHGRDPPRTQQTAAYLGNSNKWIETGSQIPSLDQHEGSSPSEIVVWQII